MNAFSECIDKVRFIILCFPLQLIDLLFHSIVFMNVYSEFWKKHVDSNSHRNDATTQITPLHYSRYIHTYVCSWRPTQNVLNGFPFTSKEPTTNTNGWMHTHTHTVMTPPGAPHSTPLCVYPLDECVSSLCRICCSIYHTCDVVCERASVHPGDRVYNVWWKPKINRTTIIGI